jgi:predicted aminopeptidase
VYDQTLARNNQFVHLIMDTRERLKKLYGAPKAPSTRLDELRRDKQRVFDDLRKQYSDLKTQWGGYSGYDEWFAHDLNNAKLNTVANYYDYVPGFQRLLQSNGGDLERFYAAAERLSKVPIEERHQRLRVLAKEK